MLSREGRYACSIIGTLSGAIGSMRPEIESALKGFADEVRRETLLECADLISCEPYNAESMIRALTSDSQGGDDGEES